MNDIKSKKILAISAGQFLHKKITNPIKRRIRYLNYGLLGLATIIKNKLGLDISVFQGDEKTPQELIDII